MAQVNTMKRGNYYQYRFEIAPQDGKRKFINKSGFKTKQEAYEAGMKAYNEYTNAGNVFKPSTVSFSDYLDYWMKMYCNINLRYATIITYENIIKNHIKPRLGFYRLSQITSATIQEFINNIYVEKAGIYVDTIMGPYGGYVLNQQIRMPIRKFKLKDTKLLDKYILKEKDKKIKEELIMLQDKIKGVYIGSKQEEKELNLKEETGKKYNLLTRAIKEKRKVKLLYYSYGKGENQRIIYPAEMFLFQNGWYCAAFCEMRQDIRHFELKRIINCELLDEKYE